MLGKEIGISDLPNQRHKIVSKQGAHYTMMVVGESGVGKTTFINTLFTSLVKTPADEGLRHGRQLERKVGIEIHKADLEENGFKLRLNVVDTPGFGDYVDNSEAALPIVEFIDQQYQSMLRQEKQPMRSAKIDQRVHCCLYFVRPSGKGLKPLDVAVMKQLGSRVNLIPVIAKADTLTSADLKKFKKRIRMMLMENGIRVYQVDKEEDDNDAIAKLDDEIMGAMPFAIVGSIKDVVTKDGRTVKGRDYPWGVVEVENPDHCDFVKLRELLIRTHMLDLISSTENIHYDEYRQREQSGQTGARFSQLNQRFREEEDNLRRRFTEQVKQEENRFKQWEAKLIGERDRLNQDLEHEHAAIKQLESEMEFRNVRK